MKIYIIALLLFFSSCTAEKKLTTGIYTVATVNGNLVTLQGYKQTFVVPTDTLKPGDKIPVFVIGKQQRQMPIRF